MRVLADLSSRHPLRLRGDDSSGHENMKSKTAAGPATRFLEQYRAQGPVADIEVYNKAIVENWHADRTEVCVRLFEDLQKEGLTPNKWTHNAVACVCYITGHVHVDLEQVERVATISS